MRAKGLLQTIAVPASDPIGVLLADSNQMQNQLLAGALRRRRPEFQVTSCVLDADVIAHAIGSFHIQVAILNTDNPKDGSPDMTVIRRLHLAHPEVAKIILLNTYDREIVVNAFRSGPAVCFVSLSTASGCFPSAFRACIRDRYGQTVNSCNSSSRR